jgi:hypothetical protein
MTRVYRILIGSICGVTGISALILPFISVEVGAIGIALSASTYNLINFLDLLSTIERNYTIALLTTICYALGSVLSLFSSIDRQRVSIIGVVMQLIAAGAFVYGIAIKQSIFVNTSPEVGLYLMIVAPIIGLVVTLYYM